MTDINLFDKSGFQERMVEPLTKPETESIPRKKKKSKEMKKLRFFPKEEIYAMLVAIGIGLLVWWYYSLTTFVRSDIKEFTPQEFMRRLESGQDNISWLHALEL